MPCFEPGMMLEAGLSFVAEDWMEGRKVEIPFMTPNRFTSMIF
jgi:hypothetical protein